MQADTTAVVEEAQRKAEKAAQRALAASEFDFNSLASSAGLMLNRPSRRGVAIMAATTQALPDDAVNSLLAWRLGQYLLTGFYDPDSVEKAGLSGEPKAIIGDADIHGIALDDEGQILAYVTFKQPSEVSGDKHHTFRDPNRPAFPCEEIHGRAWQRQILGVDDVELSSCWELARFVVDQRRRDEPVARRAPLELALAVGRLMSHPHHQQKIRLITGDVDPKVALRSLRYFFMPVATFLPHKVELEEGHMLRPRYANHQTAPFIARTDDLEYATWIRWADIDLALSCVDEVALMRLLALRQIVSVKESSLKRPLVPGEDSIYPLEALTNASSDATSDAMWRAAKRGSIPWQATELGPCDALSTDEVHWVVEGYVQVEAEGEQGNYHLAALGRQVAFVPSFMGDIVSLEAVSPVRCITTSREHFEDFWAQRQKLFETATEAIYE